MAEVTYQLDGPTQFVYPYPVQFAGEIVLQVIPGTTVPPAQYEVIGAGPESQAVTIEWPQAPFDGTKELLIYRVIDPDRIANFTQSGIFAEALDAEFNHLYAILGNYKHILERVKFWAKRAKAWAIKYPDPVISGEYSAYYWAVQSALNAEANGVPYYIEDTQYGIRILSAGPSQGVQPYLYFVGFSKYGQFVFLTDESKADFHPSPPAPYEYITLEIMQ